MPTELEDLVEFLHHGNTQIRQVAVEHLVGYSTAQPSIFKTGQLTPVKDLKLLVKDYNPIAKNALTILINLSADRDVLANLAEDDAFLETLLARILSPTEPNADDHAALLANLAKHPSLARLLGHTRPAPAALPGGAPQTLTQLASGFVRGADGRYNPRASYDHLAYLFADLAALPAGRAYLTTPQTAGDDAGVIPLAQLAVFTAHPSAVRRRGVAAALRNAAFDVAAHRVLVDPAAANVLPYLLLPLMAGEDYPPAEADAMLDDCQLLPADKRREPEPEVLVALVETLALLATTRPVRDRLRAVQVYPILRECHLAVEDEAVREAIERVVDVLMREEEPADGENGGGRSGTVEEVRDEDEEIVDVL